MAQGSGEDPELNLRGTVLSVSCENVLSTIVYYRKCRRLGGHSPGCGRE